MSHLLGIRKTNNSQLCTLNIIAVNYTIYILTGARKGQGFYLEYRHYSTYILLCLSFISYYDDLAYCMNE